MNSFTLRKLKPFHDSRGRKNVIPCFFGCCVGNTLNMGQVFDKCAISRILHYFTKLPREYIF